MSVLVTVGAGYIGSHMVHALVDLGERVIVLDNLTTGFDWAVPKGATLVIAETRDQSRVGALIAECTKSRPSSISLPRSSYPIRFAILSAIIATTP